MAKPSHIRSTLLIIILLFQASAVHAANEALIELLKALHGNGTIDNRTYQLVLRAAEREDGEQTPLASRQIDEKIEKTIETKLAESNHGASPVAINTRGKFEVSDREGDFKFRIGGRVQTDAATYNEDGLRHNDGTELRRVRLFARGTLVYYR